MWLQADMRWEPSAQPDIRSSPDPATRPPVSNSNSQCSSTDSQPRLLRLKRGRRREDGKGSVLAFDRAVQGLRSSKKCHDPASMP